jgi:hypothetical protein
MCQTCQRVQQQQQLVLLGIPVLLSCAGTYLLLFLVLQQRQQDQQG